MNPTCHYCQAPLTVNGKGRLPRFCNNAHKQAYYRQNVTLRNTHPQTEQNVTLRNKTTEQLMEELGINNILKNNSREYCRVFTAELIRLMFPNIADIAPHLLLVSWSPQEQKARQKRMVGVLTGVNP